MEDSQNIIAQKLSQLNTVLTSARTDRIEIEVLAKDSVERKLHEIEALAKDSLEKKLQKIKALSAKKSPPLTQTRNGIISWPFGNKMKEVEESSPPNEEKGEEESPPLNEEKEGEESSPPDKKKKKKWYKRIWPFGKK